MQTIGILELPVVVGLVLNGQIELVAGSFLLNEGGTCSMSRTLETTINSVTTSEDVVETCAWTGTGADLTITMSNNAVADGEVVGTTLTITLPPVFASPAITYTFLKV